MMRERDIARMIRVDQAGEFGATRIYQGQLDVMGDRGPHAAEIAEMAEQEKGHRARFDALMAHVSAWNGPLAPHADIPQPESALRITPRP